MNRQQYTEDNQEYDRTVDDEPREPVRRRIRYDAPQPQFGGGVLPAWFYIRIVVGALIAGTICEVIAKFFH